MTLLRETVELLEEQITALKKDFSPNFWDYEQIKKAWMQ